MITGFVLAVLLFWIFNGALGQVYSFLAGTGKISAPILPPIIAQAAPGTLTPFATSSPTVQLETPDGPVTGAGWRYVIHEVSPGETLDSLAIKFSTTTEVIAQANPVVRVMLTADALLLKANVQISGRQLTPGIILVIIPGLADAAGLPSFRPVYIGKDILIEDFAAAEGTPVDQLRYYNSLGDSSWLESDRWVIIPEGE